MDWIKVICFLITTELFIFGLKFIEPLFFKLAIKATTLLNILIDKELDEDEKQSQLLKNIGGVLSSTFIFLFCFIALILFAISPLYINLYFQGELDTVINFFSFEALIGMASSFGIHRAIRSRKKKQQSDYGNWSKLFHRITLNNYNIGKFLFKSKTKKLKAKQKRDKVIVSGLARSGTSAFTQKLYESGKFSSLTYASVPFLMSPQTGIKLSGNSNKKQKERAHGDKVMFGVNSTEALEEYFFKVMTNDRFIGEQELQEYSVSEGLANDYENYLQLICKESSTYLTKNNNFILRAKSHLEIDQQVKLILMVRNPLAQAESLLNQHLRFSQIQEEDPFTLEYMNWLAHHEFGKGHKPFHLKHFDQVMAYESTDINHWLASWLNYYDYALQIAKKENTTIVIYEDFVEKPIEVFKSVSSKLGIELGAKTESKFKPSQYIDRANLNEDLIQECSKLYQKYVELSRN